MKRLILLVSILIFQSGLSQAEERDFEAVVRTKNNKAKIQTVTLEDLVSEDSFDGNYFKIVLGKSEEPVKFSEDRAILLRAATTYYHLSKARHYFIDIIGSDYVKTIPKMTIRIEHTNQFSDLGHFANDNLEPQFNNALTVPAGVGLASRGVRPWGMEIWFRPRKDVNLRDLKVNDLASRETKGLLRSFRNQIHMQSLQRFLAQTVTALTASGPTPNPFALTSLVRTAGSSLMMEMGYQFIDPISKAAARKWYWLDTALVPEIIYHEYSHAALSDALVLSHSTAVIEGMADFFAGQMANSSQLAKHIKKYNTYNGKDAERNQDYMLEFEMSEYANTDFVFGLLWEMKKIVGEDQGEAFMYALRKKITTNSSVRGQLIEGLLDTCREMCKSPFNDSLKIQKALNSKGI